MTDPDNQDGQPRPTAAQRKIALIERERQALELARAGLGFDQIAAQLGYSERGGAWRAYRRALIRLGLPEDPDEWRDWLASRAVRVGQVAYQKALSGDPAAIRAFAALDRGLAQLQGADRPARLDVRVTTEMDRAIEELAAQLAGNDVAGEAVPVEEPAEEPAP